MSKTYSAEQAVEQLVREGYDREDVSVLVAQAVDINTPRTAEDWAGVTDEDLAMIRESIEGGAADEADLAEEREMER